MRVSGASGENVLPASVYLGVLCGESSMVSGSGKMQLSPRYPIGFRCYGLNAIGNIRIVVRVYDWSIPGQHEQQRYNAYDEQRQQYADPEVAAVEMLVDVVP